MDKKEYWNRVKDPRHIPGIYNYCDRWCERCAFTSRCLTFAMEEDDPLTLEERDLSNDQFWKKMMASLEFTQSLLQDLAEEEGIDLELDSLEEEVQEEPPKVVSILVAMAYKYLHLVDEWMAGEGREMEEAGLREEALPHLRPVARREERERLDSQQEAAEVIRWYQVFLPPKLDRALRSREEEKEETWDLPKDSEGSAKVALLAMDRSLGAWGELLQGLGGQNAGILKIVALLKKMRDLTEKEFPGARAFLRPGFDMDQEDLIVA